MNFRKRGFVLSLILFAFVFSLKANLYAQEKSAPEVLSEKAASVIIPSSFYFAGQSAPTQMRNAAGARQIRPPTRRRRSGS